MKKSIRNWLVALLGIVALQSAIKAAPLSPVNVRQLPAEAQKTINTYFRNQHITLTKTERTLLRQSYDVVFTNGDKLEFDRYGHWTEINSPQAEVPDGLMPAAIVRFVRTHWPQAKIRKIEKERTGYEVKLSNGIEIRFDRHLRAVDIDD